MPFRIFDLRNGSLVENRLPWSPEHAKPCANHNWASDAILEMGLPE